MNSLCAKVKKNEFGQFMGLENVTVVPIDLDAIVPEDLNKDETQLSEQLSQICIRDTFSLYDRGRKRNRTQSIHKGNLNYHRFCRS